MVGYKGFDINFQCKGKQYEINSVFEEDEAILNLKGLHYCSNPINVLNYYPILDCNGYFNRYAKVESLSEDDPFDEYKFCSKKLKIYDEIKFEDFITICNNFLYKSTNSTIKSNSLKNKERYIINQKDNFYIFCDNYAFTIKNYGRVSVISSINNETEILNNGDHSIILLNGNCSFIINNGIHSQILSMGDKNHIISNNDFCKIVSMGDYITLKSNGRHSIINDSGENNNIYSNGDKVIINSSSNKSFIKTTGDYSIVKSKGNNCIIECLGKDSMIKAKKGSIIILAECIEENNKMIPINIKKGVVDNINIMENVYYILRNGEFVRRYN